MARGERVRSLPTSRWGMFLEGVGPWRNTLLVVLIGGALFGASQVDSLRPAVAMVIAIGAPLGLLVFAATRVLDGSRALRVATVVLLLAAVGVVGRELWLVFMPPEPLVTRELTTESPDLDVDVPSTQRAFDVEVRGRLLASEGETTGRYRIELSRGDESRRLDGELYRRTRMNRVGRRGLRVQSSTTHQAARHPVEIAGTGPLHAHLAAIHGLRNRVLVSVTEAPLVGIVLWTIFGILAVFALALEAWAGRQGLSATLTAAVVSSEVLAVHLVYRYDPADPLTAVFGGLLFAALAGGVGGFVVGAVAAAAARPRASPKEIRSRGG